MKKILVVDDEKHIVEIIKAYLEQNGFKANTAYDGKTALELLNSQSPDLIILDLMLPEISGWDVCREVRKKSDIPIIMLTARDDTTDKIIGLELGADDYVTKPFDPKELVTRVKAILRRSDKRTDRKPIITAGDLTIDIEKHQVTKNNKTIGLTPIEFQLLQSLAESPGRVYSRSQLLSKLQDDAYEGYERTIDSHIKNIRKKIEVDSDQPKFIITVYGVGYKFAEEII